MTLDAQYYRDLLDPVFRGRRFLIIGGTIAGQLSLARELRGLGAERPFLLGSALGARRAPDPEEAAWRTLDVRGESFIGAIWNYEAKLEDPPAEVRAAIDAWDPDGGARALGYIVLGDVRSVAGRGRYGQRPPEWMALEDKTRVHGVLDRVGIKRGPLAIAMAESGCLRAAHARVDRGAGTVWAGDTRPGIHGGASYLRWVSSPETEDEACRFFASRCDRVRVMPFVEGIPCSVHALVCPQGVAVFRPVELITLRRHAEGRFLYAGTASFFDPPPRCRDEMRSLAGTVGLSLRAEVGYRGPMTLDGVLGEDGFVPTELNPRFGAGMSHLQLACPELPLGPLALAAQHGEPLDYRPEDLERLVLEAADARRSGSGRLHLDRRVEEPDERPLALEGAAFRLAVDGEASAGVVGVGPSTVGGFVSFRPHPDAVEPGPSFAPRVVEAFGVADAELGTSIGRVFAPRARTPAAASW